jgi:hypothetical protein
VEVSALCAVTILNRNRMLVKQGTMEELEIGVYRSGLSFSLAGYMCRQSKQPKRTSSLRRLNRLNPYV